MSKITSKQIKEIIAKRAHEILSAKVSSIPNGQPAFWEADLEKILIPKLWKRQEKCKNKNVDEFMGMDSLPVNKEDEENFSYDFSDWFLEEEITPECIVRHFMHDSLDDALDPYVATNPEDTKIIAIFWHSD